MNLRVMEGLVKEAGKSFLTRDMWDRIKELNDYRCAYCGEQTDDLTKDHIVPLSRQGLHTEDNVTPACRPCNSEKGDKLPEEWLEPYWWREGVESD